MLFQQHSNRILWYHDVIVTWRIWLKKACLIRMCDSDINDCLEDKLVNNSRWHRLQKIYRASVKNDRTIKWNRNAFCKNDIDERHDSLEHSNGSNIEISILIRQEESSVLCLYMHKLLRARRKKRSSKNSRLHDSVRDRPVADEL